MCQVSSRCSLRSFQTEATERKKKKSRFSFKLGRCKDNLLLCFLSRPMNVNVWGRLEMTVPSRSHIESIKLCLCAHIWPNYDSVQVLNVPLLPLRAVCHLDFWRSSCWLQATSAGATTVTNLLFILTHKYLPHILPPPPPTPLSREVLRHLL